MASERSLIDAEERYIRAELKRLRLRSLPKRKKRQILELGMDSERPDWVQAGYERWQQIRSNPRRRSNKAA